MGSSRLSGGAPRRFPRGSPWLQSVNKEPLEETLKDLPKTDTCWKEVPVINPSGC